MELQEELSLLQHIPGLDDNAMKRVIEWLQESDEKMRLEVIDLIHSNPKALVDAFYTTLAFGTGGLRGIMGPGSNRMNEQTVSSATQGLANYMLKTLPKELLRVAIGYDSRHNSYSFAATAASVLAGNGIEVFLFKTLRPTPLVSFACRYKKCGAAIMITASHNPPNYNGYKVYWSDGGQLLPPHDIGMIDEVNKVNVRSRIKRSPFPHPLIHIMGDEIDTAYLQAIQPFLKNENQKASLKILYSNLHGTGITMVPKALAQTGFNELSYVEEQKEPDGNFPTTSAPNPEEPAALKLGIARLEKEAFDLFLATDPDCDRIGVVVYHEHKSVRLTGNEVACIACDYVCRMTPDLTRAACVKSIVTSDLFNAICANYKVACFEVLTGFKYIAEKIREWESMSNGYRYLFGGEESYGYLLGTHVRDKDAVILACLIADMAAYMKKQGKTLVDYIYQLYRTYGVYREQLMTLQYEEGKAGKEKQTQILEALRRKTPVTIGDSSVLRVSDYLTRQRKNITTGQIEQIALPASDVLLFELADRSKIYIRPSGTEPKTKIYLMGYETYEHEPITHVIARCDAKLEQLKKSMQMLLN